MTTSWLDLLHLHLSECRRCDETPFDLCGKGDALMRAAAAALVLAGPGTAPDRTTDGFRSTHNAPPTEERTLVMSTTPTGEGSTAGSNPAGVASPTTPEETGNSDRTELRSVPTNENRRGAWTCLGCQKLNAGPRSECINCGAEAPDPQVFCECDPPGQVDGKPGCQHCGFPFWTPPVSLGQAAADPGNPILEAADQFNQKQDVFAVPTVQRCTVQVTESSFAQECGAIVGTDLRCALCAGQRCYQHCGGVDHFRGRLVSRGGTEHFDWKVVEIAAGRFMGQLWERMLPDGRPELRTTSTGLTAERAATDLAEQAKVYEESWLKMPVPPRVRRIDDATDQLLAASRGKLSDKKRAELLLEVIEWIREDELAWGCFESEVELPSKGYLDLVAKAKKLHDQRVVELFSRLAGAL